MKKRGKITWTGAPPDRASTKIRSRNRRGKAVGPTVIHQRYSAPVDTDDELKDSLVTGALFYNTHALYVREVLPKHARPEFPVLGSYPYGTFGRGPGPELPAGSFLIYAGQVRTTETAANGVNIRVTRHTFVNGTGRYIIPNIMWMKPVEETSR